MFYDIRVMNSERMGPVWRAANNVDTDTSDVNLRKVCAHISKWTDNYEDNSRRHLSLRTSSMMVNGAARILKEQLDSLYDDCAQLSEELITWRRSTNSNVDESSNGPTSTDASTSKNSTRRTSKSQKPSSPTRRQTSEHLSKPSFRPSTGLPPSNIIDESQNERRKNNSNSRNVPKINKETQTTRSAKKLREEQEKEKRNNKTTNKPNMGVVLAFENESHLPTRIISSQINMNALPQ